MIKENSIRSYVSYSRLKHLHDLYNFTLSTLQGMMKFGRANLRTPPPSKNTVVSPLLVLNAIKDKYFDKGLRDHLSEDYEPVGMIMG